MFLADDEEALMEGKLQLKCAEPVLLTRETLMGSTAARDPAAAARRGTESAAIARWGMGAVGVCAHVC